MKKILLLLGSFFVASLGAQQLVFDQHDDLHREILVQYSQSQDVCAQDVPSNNLENGLVVGGTSNQAIAVDIPVGSEVFRISTVTVNTLDETQIINIKFLEDNNGLPGEMLHDLGDVNITTSELIGSVSEIPFYRNTMELTTPVELEGPARFWMQVDTDALGWEAASQNAIGLTCAVKNDGSNQQWNIHWSEYEMVYTLEGECTVLSTGEVFRKTAGIYPNPVNDVLTVQSLKNIESYAITNMEGRKMKNSNSGFKNLNVAHLTPGVYLLTLKYDDQSVETIRFVKK